MAWLILLVPLCIWLGVSIISHMSLVTLLCIIIVIGIFALVEFGKLRGEHGRPKNILWSMLIILATLIIDAFIR